MKRRELTGLLVVAAGAGILALVFWPRPLLPDPPVRHVFSEAEKEAVPPLLAGRWGTGHEERVGKVEALHGVTKDRVLSELGEPNQAYEFSVEEFHGEFRIELWNTYPPGHRRSRGVRILEWVWRYKEFSFAVWFHKVDGSWVVLDTCGWRKGIEF